MKALDGTEIELPISDAKMNQLLSEYEKFYKEFSNERPPNKNQMLLELGGAILLGEKEIELYSHSSKDGKKKIFKLKY